MLLSDSLMTKCRNKPLTFNKMHIVLVGYIGTDCLLAEGEVPTVYEIIPDTNCDVRNRPCKKIRLSVKNVVTTNR